jgi:ribitol-5-phosphate 2-dehydrogenase
VKPKFLSICAADTRYYFGLRDKKVMDEKLPMALIHEAVGEVLYDPMGVYKSGTPVVMIPNTPSNQGHHKSNYDKTSKFRGSGYDGFMQSFVVMNRNLILDISKIDMLAGTLLELMSVSVNAISSLIQAINKIGYTILIWGDGNLAFTTCLCLKYICPSKKIIVVGKSKNKLNYFSFIKHKYTINNLPSDLKFDHAFECVGGPAAEEVINNIINMINPEGSIALMGVSENNVAINTRMLLEKGITVIGNSRSDIIDFQIAVDILSDIAEAQEYLKTIISEIVEVKTIDDIHKAFNNDLTNDFKTIMRWNI